MPSDDEIKDAVTSALNMRRASATPDESATLVQLVAGKLRTAFSSPPLDQVADKMTDLFLAGRRDMPPDSHRPDLRGLVRSDFGTFHIPAPPDAVIEVLVNVAIGWMIDHSLPTPPGGRPILMHSVDSLYLAGV